ncbi:MAG: hypothetical protein CAF44_016140, partial [Nitrospira sp. CG24D]
MLMESFVGIMALLAAAV